MRAPHLLALTAAVLATATGCVSVSVPVPRTVPSGPVPAPSVPERPGAPVPSERAPHQQVVTAPRRSAPPEDATAPAADPDGTAVDARARAESSAPDRRRHPAPPQHAGPPPHHHDRPRPAHAAPPQHRPAVGPPRPRTTMDPRVICQMASGKVRSDLLRLCQGAFGS
ncbi:hypothetical protein ACFVT2_31155 [Streptomyces sp. NPDC058000]|uniref:hypothetical protein n=1 Tax=Streptomyces sp. NPDC058000 TaxID=3346299 RepID=UPI0036EFE9E2